jgi:hypothetical protein
VLADDVEEGLLLAGEARVGQVFGGRTAAHRDGHRMLAARELPVGGADGVGGVVGEAAAEDRIADRQPGDLEGRLTRVVALERGGDPVGERVRVDERPEGGARRGEAAGHAHALRPEFADHLAERGVLAADLGDVDESDLGEIDDVLHASPPRWVGPTLRTPHHPE